ncbi:DUF805 domain-containing protein [Sporosarcina sp. NCCP-2716]|uniref:DUF805 domain-containing protein n=1 Tax=Sporosarcina sp. NCCP-2716 TaxID=2943679 RepID=UPI002040CA12|nr:DUF805 domain-containing protein [Sporosarcina sp. NCCP-2716]
MEYIWAAFKRTFEIRGRSRRTEYWMYTLFISIIGVIFVIVDGVMGWELDEDLGVTSAVFLLLTLITSVTVLIRRLHDTGRTGWWILLSFIPLVGSIVLFIFTVLDSTPGANKYGPNPKEYSDGL